MFKFSRVSVVLLFIFMLLFGGVVMAQDTVIVTNTPKAAVDEDAGSVLTPVDVVAPVEEEGGFIESLTGQVLLFATAAVISVSVVTLVIFIAFIRVVVPALKASIAPEWQPVLFPIIDGAETALSGAAVDLLKRLEQKAAETETEIDDEVIGRLWELIAPKPPEAQVDNRF